LTKTVRPDILLKQYRFRKLLELSDIESMGFFENFCMETFRRR